MLGRALRTKPLWHNNSRLSSRKIATEVASSSSGSGAKKRIVFGGATVVFISGIAYVQSDSERRNNAKLKLESVSRVCSLIGTVSMMTLSYVNFFYFANSLLRGGMSKYALLESELKDLQNKQEIWTIELMTSQSRMRKSRVPKHEIKELELRLAELKTIIASSRNRINAVTEEMASLMGSGDNCTEITALHRLNAKRLREMCSKNGGLYIKLGQHLAMLDHIIPLEYQEELTNLLANTPTSSFDAVRRIFKKDLGKEPADLFAKFEQTPIASASLAQVHMATGHDGAKYAVKVQHEGLREGSIVDRLVITFLIDDLLPVIFPEFNYKFLSKEMNINLPLELDFQAERSNLVQCREYLRSLIDLGDVAVPDDFPALSSPRVLTMSFEEGVYVNSSQCQATFSPSLTSRTISTVFSEQIYRHGFVHCDPHEANILIRQHPNKSAGTPQVVLLDHGLYRTLDEPFRKAYCRLWQSLVLGDEAGIKSNCKKLHVGQAYTLLAAMLTMKPWDDIVTAADSTGGSSVDNLKQKATKADQILLQSYAQKYFKEIVHLLGSVPSELLLLFKTNDCLRHLDRSLGTPINTASVVATVTADVILREELQQAWSMDQSEQEVQLETRENNGADELSEEERKEVQKSSSKYADVDADADTELDTQPLEMTPKANRTASGNLVSHLLWSIGLTVRAIWKYANVKLRVAGLSLVGIFLRF